MACGWWRQGRLRRLARPTTWLQSVGKKVDTYDLHATVLQLLGLDHLKTIYLRAGRAERPTVVYGEVVKDLLA